MKPYMNVFCVCVSSQTTHIVNLLYLAFLYLAEAVIIMPSPRNNIWDLFNLAAALSVNGQSAKSKLITTIIFL